MDLEQLRQLAGLHRRKAALHKKLAEYLEKSQKGMAAIDQQIAAMERGDKVSAVSGRKKTTRASRGRFREEFENIMKRVKKDKPLTAREIENLMKKKGLPTASVRTYLSRHSNKLPGR